MIIEVNKLRKEYGNKIILDNLNMAIPEASVYGLVGKNGAGKTTFLNILAGISDATSGDCIVYGNNIRKGKNAPGILSYLPDLPNFFDYLTVKEYIRFILSANTVQKINHFADAEKKIEDIGISKNAKIKTLSRGNKQKLGILIAIITQPKVLVLDEPTSALDPIGRREVMTLIRQLREQGITVLFSSHILSDMELVCDRIGFLHKGTIQREIDLNSRTDQESYEIQINEADKASDRICQLLPEYKIQVTAEKNKIVCHPKNRQNNQSEFFSAISRLDMEVLSVKKTYRYDLEAVMDEVLSV